MKTSSCLHAKHQNGFVMIKRMIELKTATRNVEVVNVKNAIKMEVKVTVVDKGFSMDVPIKPFLLLLLFIIHVYTVSILLKDYKVTLTGIKSQIFVSVFNQMTKIVILEPGKDLQSNYSETMFKSTRSCPDSKITNTACPLESLTLKMTHLV